MKNDVAVNNIFDLGGARYPHFVVTDERFPRVLATRRVFENGGDYFGAFLPKTAVRIMIDLINRTFKLRTCSIDIDGSFAVPCTQYFHRRCLAPCVNSICSPAEYSEMVEMVRHFLADDREELSELLHQRIGNLSDDLDFESAAKYRDILIAVERVWTDARRRIWLEDSTDTFAVEDTAAGTAIFLVSHRGNKILGRKVFNIDRESAESSDIALAEIIDDFYLFHLPREIRVSRDFSERRALTARLTERHRRGAKITVVDPRTRAINAARGLFQSHDEHELDKAKPIATADVIGSKLRKTFGLDKTPARIEAFDVAHLSGTAFVAAASVWLKGKFVSEEYSFVVSDQATELNALADAVLRRLADEKRPIPDLILLDGGKPQLNTVIKALSNACNHPAVIAAVKPRGKHTSIAQFLSPAMPPVEFNVDSPAHSMLQLLRDDAHDLANRVHRDLREMAPFYESRGYGAPFIVPISYFAENGGAEDLRPIDAA